MKKIRIHGECVYIFASLLLALAVAMMSAADFGISMVVAPSYLISLKTGFLTFGQAEYAVQAVLFIIFCICMKGFKPIYLFAFCTCLIYGALLDLWRLLPLFNPSVTPPGSMALPLRAVLFVLGMIFTSMAVAAYFKTYLYPQVNDFFVKEVSRKYKIKLAVFKTAFDIGFLVLSAILTFAFFGKICGINFGTVIMAAVSGTLVGFFDKLYDRMFEVVPFFPAAAKRFSVD